MALRELLAVFDVNVKGDAALNRVSKQIDRAKIAATSLDSAIGVLKGGFAALGGFLAVRQITAWTKEVLDAADAAADIGDAVGLTAEQFQAFDYFGKTAGGADMRTALTVLAKSAESGHKAFADLGVSLKDASGQFRPMADIATDSLAALADLDDGTKRVAYSAQLFGRSGNVLIPSLKNGSKAFRETFAEAQRLGVAFDTDLTENAGTFNDTLYGLRMQSLAFRGMLVKMFLPAMQGLATWFTETTFRINAWQKKTGGLETSLKSLGVTAGIVAAAMAVSKFTAVAGGFQKINAAAGMLTKRFLILAAVFLAIEDFFSFLQGKDSVIGDVLESLGLIDDANESGKRFGQTLKDNLVPAIQGVGQSIGRFFSETMIGFGALVGMATASSGSMRDEFEGAFLRNTATIDAFGSAVFTVFQAIPNMLIGPLASALQSFVGWSAGSIAQVLSVAGSFVGIDASIAKITAGIQTAGDLVANLLTNPLGGVADIVAKIQGRGFDRSGIAEINAANQAAAQARRTAAAAGGARAPALPPGGGNGTRSVNLTDARIVNVNVQGGGSPAAVGRAVAGAVAPVLTSDRGRTLAAVSR